MARTKTTKKTSSRKLPRVIKISKTQTGKTTIKVDRKRKALHAGVRLSKAGNLYTEKRRNRSDKNLSTRL